MFDLCLERERDESDMWSHLAYDPLVKIFESLSIPDLFSVASVCSSWRCAAALKDKSRHLHRFKVQKPWLVFSDDRESSSTFANFYSISEGKFYAIGRQPGLASLNTCLLIGSDHGWIIAADQRSELLLINPMTRKQIALPPVSTMDIILPRLDESGDNIISYGVEKIESGDSWFTTRVHEYTLEDLRHSLYWKACLSSPPSSTGGYTIVVLLHNRGSLAFARSGDARWTMINDVWSSFVDVHFHRISYNDNEVVLHTTNHFGKVEGWDLTSNNNRAWVIRKEEDVLPELKKLDSLDYDFYLVPTAWGDLLQVRRLRRGVHYLTWRIQVFRVDLGSRTLVKVESLGNYAIFVGASSPVCVSTLDAPGLKPDCVYFTDDYSEPDELPIDIGIFSLKDGTIESILPDDSQLYLPPPIWFTPSLL